MILLESCEMARQDFNNQFDETADCAGTRSGLWSDKISAIFGG